MVGARCLDLFAGSGALGLESLSRGAAHVTFVEHDGAAVKELIARLSEWGATGAHVEHGDALRFLNGGGGGSPGRAAGAGAGTGTSMGAPFDIVFLDPPFDSGLLTTAAGLLEQGQFLVSGALIYVECAARNGLPELPPNWVASRAKQAGEVGYYLLTRA